MLPRFQRLSCDGSGSLSLSASFTSLRPPRTEEDLLSSATSHRTVVSEDVTSTCPPSPTPLVFISVPLPARASTAARTTAEVVGLVRSPARADAPTSACQAESSDEDATLTPQERHAMLRASAVYEDVVRYGGVCSSDDDGDESTPFDGTTMSAVSRNCDNNASSGSSSSSSAARLAEWGVLWMHVFPRHIAAYLVVRDVVQVGMVCRAAQEAVQQPWVWRSLAVAHHAVHPANIERMYRRAAQQWVREGDTLAVVEDAAASYHAAPARLKVCDHVHAVPLPLPPQPPVEQPSPRHVNGVRALTSSTSTTPWLQRQNSGVPSGEDVVEFGDETEDEDAEAEEEEEAAAFNTTQPLPQQQHEEEQEGAMAEVTLTMSLLAEAAQMIPQPCATAAAAAATRSAARAALAAGSHYLWQTAAAAMPSPSSPVTTPHAEDEEEEEHASQRTTSEVPQPICNTLAPACVSSAPAARAAAACCGDVHPSTGLTRKSGVTLREQLPPPSPAMLDDVDGADLHHHGGSCDGASHHSSTDTYRPAHEESVRSASVTSPPNVGTQRSFTMGMATDVNVTSSIGEGGVVPHAAGGSRCRCCSGSAWCVRDSVNASPEPVPSYCFTLCRVTAERSLLRPAPEFPWQLFTRYLHVHRVHNSLSRFVALSHRARAELCRGDWVAAYGSLSHAIHALCQQGSCRGVEHLTHLAQALVRRASLCRHRGHQHLRAAFTDLCTAALLCPHLMDVVDVSELCAREELAMATPELWLQSNEEAALVASPTALLGSVAQVPLLFPQHRTLCFCAAVTAYMRAHHLLGHSLAHLLVRAAEAATPGTEEELLVRALRETAVAAQSQQRFHAHRACATADYALSLVPRALRSAADELCAAWVRDNAHPIAATSGSAMLRWSAEAPEAVAYAHGTALEVRWLAWLTCEVQCFVYKELTDAVPPRTALMALVLSTTRHDAADALVRVAAQYASEEARVEDLCPPLARGVSRRSATVHLLHSALALRPLHPTAALLLSRVYASAEEDAPLASAVLTDCIHRWARRFELLSLDTTPATTATSAWTPPPGAYLRRRDRSPEVCYVPAELLVGRNRCLHMVADLAEATEQHPSLSYPYQMRAAMAMDRGYCLAAVHEMGRIIALSLDVSDVALRVRFLEDAADAPTSLAPSPRGVETAAQPTPTPGAVAETTSQQVLLPIYRAWLTRMSGLLALLHAPEAAPSHGDEGEHDDGGSASFRGGQSCSRFFTRELPSITTQDVGGGHVSRVASLAVSEGDGDGALLSGAASAVGAHATANAADIRAFLEDLVRTTNPRGDAPAHS